MNQKVLFIDVDGTLVNYSNELPKSAIEAIGKARANGHKVYICTGRSEAEVYPYIWDIGLDGMIGGNGAYIKDGDTVIFDQCLSLEEETKIVDWLESRGLEFYLEATDGLFASKNFETRAQPTINEYSQRKGRGPTTIREVFPDMIFGANLYRGDVHKISFVLDSFQDHLDSKEAFPNTKAGTWGGAGQTALFGDLGIQDIDKAFAIDKLLSYIGANVEDTIAFGDAQVDISMFENCALSVAMGNGSKECKEAASFVTSDVDEDGLYKAFEKLNLF